MLHQLASHGLLDLEDHGNGRTSHRRPHHQRRRGHRRGQPWPGPLGRGAAARAIQRFRRILRAPSMRRWWPGGARLAPASPTLSYDLVIPGPADRHLNDTELVQEFFVGVVKTPASPCTSASSPASNSHHSSRACFKPSPGPLRLAGRSRPPPRPARCPSSKETAGAGRRADPNVMVR